LSIHGLDYTLFDGLLVCVTGGLNTGVVQDALDDDRPASSISSNCFDTVSYIDLSFALVYAILGQVSL
jgi:hypothetical protein